MRSAVGEETRTADTGRDRACVEAANRYGTPVYLYDFDRLEESVRDLRDTLPDRFDLFYAIKANPSLAVLRLMADHGLGADVASRGELLAARRAGIPARRTVMAGPAKSEADLRAAVSEGLLGVNVEGRAELDRLNGMAARSGTRVDIQLRLRLPGQWGEEAAILSGGGGGKFGFSLDAAGRALADRDRWPNLRFRGFHVFQASNLLDADRIAANTRRALRASIHLAREHGLALRSVDLGGGFGVPDRRDRPPLDLERLHRALSSVASDAESESGLSGTRLIFEPGRYLVAEAGTYVTRVREVKETSGGKWHVLVDGGIHHLLRPALIGGEPPVSLIPRTGDHREERDTVRASVSGPLCTGRDVLRRDARLPRPRPGDILAVERVGAYGYSESMPLFLSHPWPAEVARRGNHMDLIRPRVEPECILDQQRLPDL